VSEALALDGVVGAAGRTPARNILKLFSISPSREGLIGMAGTKKAMARGAGRWKHPCAG